MEIDAGRAKTPEELHGLLAEALGFPGYYGKNWDAFWDCVRDPEQSSMPAELAFKGLSELEKTMPKEAAMLRRCLADLAAERPDVRVRLL